MVGWMIDGLIAAMISIESVSAAAAAAALQASSWSSDSSRIHGVLGDQCAVEAELLGQQDLIAYPRP